MIVSKDVTIYMKVQKVWQKADTGYKNYTGPVLQGQSVEKIQAYKNRQVQSLKNCLSGTF